MHEVPSKENRMLKKIFLFVGMLGCITAEMTGQQIPSYSQYMDNMFVINPGAAGAYGISVLNLSSRQQWLGIEGAPRTQSVSFQGRILKKGWLLKNTIGLFGDSKKYVGKTSGRVGMGGMLFNDKIGLIRRTGFQYTYAYHVFIGMTQISFGLTGQLYQLKLDYDKAEVSSPNDPVLMGSGVRSLWIPDFNTGIHVTHKSFYGGISASSLAQSALALGNDRLQDYSLYRHYYLVAGYVFYTKKVFIEPSFMYRTTFRYGHLVDLSVRATFKNTFWVGSSVRTNGDIVGLAGIRFNDIYFGYAFDYSTTSFRFSTFGTHEISISYKMGSIERRFRWQERY